MGMVLHFQKNEGADHIFTCWVLANLLSVIYVNRSRKVQNNFEPHANKIMGWLKHFLGPAHFKGSCTSMCCCSMSTACKRCWSWHHAATTGISRLHTLLDLPWWRGMLTRHQLKWWASKTRRRLFCSTISKELWLRLLVAIKMEVFTTGSSALSWKWGLRVTNGPNQVRILEHIFSKSKSACIPERKLWFHSFFDEGSWRYAIERAGIPGPATATGRSPNPHRGP